MRSGISSGGTAGTSAGASGAYGGRADPGGNRSRRGEPARADRRAAVVVVPRACDATRRRTNCSRSRRLLTSTFCPFRSRPSRSRSILAALRSPRRLRLAHTEVSVRQSWLSPLAACRPAGAKGLGVFAVDGDPGGHDRRRIRRLCRRPGRARHARRGDPHARAPDRRRPLHRERAAVRRRRLRQSLVRSQLRHRRIGPARDDARRRGRRGALLRLRDDRHRRLRRVRVLVRHRAVPGHDHRRRLEGTRAARPLPRLVLGLHRASAARSERATVAGWTRASDSSRRSTAPPPRCRSTSPRSASPRTRIPGSTSTSGSARLDDAGRRAARRRRSTRCARTSSSTRASPATSTTTTIPRTRSSTR